MKMICIMCPLGCELNVEKKGEEIIVTGNSCVRGPRYAVDELTCPKRVVTTLVKTLNGVLPVKTTAPVPKDKVNDVIKEISKITTKCEKIGDIVIKNVLDLNVDVVITASAVNYD